MTRPPDRDPTVSRRALLAGGAGVLLGACSSDGDASRADGSSVDGTDTALPSTSAPTTTVGLSPAEAPEYSGDFPFTLGVASGDPDGGSVVLWTRLAPDPLVGGGMPDTEQPVAWDVATDEDFADLVASGVAVASPGHGHSLHVLADGLDADSWFWFRFRVGDHMAIGRTRTAAAAGAESALRFAFSSCQNWESGGYAAHRSLSELDDVDLFVWLGDYIYEYGPGDGSVVTAAGPRVYNSPEVMELAGYRNRYALHKSDPNLRAHHAARPWVVTWDDHEVVNNHTGTFVDGAEGGEAFAARRRAAYQAWWEHMPVRLEPPGDGPYEIHRTLDWGDLVALHMLDGRQYRDPAPTDGEPVDLPGEIVIQRQGPTALDPDHSMLGPAQEEWLIAEVSSSAARWNVLGNQVYMHGINAFPGAPPAVNTDSWDGYHGNRERLLEALAASGPENLVVITGDFHASTVAQVRTDPFDAAAPVVATEFMAPSISSRFPASLEPLAPLALTVNPQVFDFDVRNGYFLCTVDVDGWLTEHHTVADVTDEQSDVSLSATFFLRSGAPGEVTFDRVDAS